ncbi:MULTISPECIES: hypothetical protein [Roseobacteraceae]|jgi:hypothetical protein|uniref:Uncharacterized protein n=1 Tax=Pseudosulfitobacter pseudonitzschiae TaxID=1402135 RepID=A0A221K5A3_9RHOB|nr:MULTISPECIES: hypothetical protein [Roseobacteraceae]ASM74027.1 hypothetical protein SULPSESMR1_03251 [Pseudosulfitobacter pseudonitzschiae]
MSKFTKTDVLVAAQILDLIKQERAKALSKREWQHRIAGYGYGIRDTQHGQIVETLPHHVPVCTLPPELAA